MEKTKQSSLEIPYQGKQVRKGHVGNVKKAQAKHHRGQMNIEHYIEDRAKRNSAFCKRKHTLFKAARTLVNLSKCRLYLRIQHQDGRAAEVFNSEKEDERTLGLSAAGEEPQASSSKEHDSPLSPNFIITEVEHVSKETQCSSQSECSDSTKCRVCGEGDIQSKDWLGCEKCEYWVHIQCLGFESVQKIFLKKVKWFCPLHRK